MTAIAKSSKSYYAFLKKLKEIMLKNTRLDYYDSPIENIN
jgi:hypothetical protein